MERKRKREIGEEEGITKGRRAANKSLSPPTHKKKRNKKKGEKDEEEGKKE